MKLEDFLSDQNKTETKEITHPFKKVKVRSDYVYVDLEDEGIMVSIEDYFRYEIRNKKGLDDDTYKQLKDHEIILKAYRSCLRKLSAKDYTIRQIKDHLYKQGLHKENVEQLVDKLIQYGLLDDEKYCINKIGYYDNSLLSYKQISQKLKNEGISEALLDKYLKYDHQREDDKAVKQAQKHVGSTKNKSVEALKQAILAKLVSNGFSYEIGNDVLNELELSADNEDELLQKEYDKALKKYSKRYEGYELRQRIFGSLLSKGFGSDDIRKVLEVENG